MLGGERIQEFSGKFMFLFLISICVQCNLIVPTITDGSETAFEMFEQIEQLYVWGFQSSYKKTFSAQESPSDCAWNSGSYQEQSTDTFCPPSGFCR